MALGKMEMNVIIGGKNVARTIEAEEDHPQAFDDIPLGAAKAVTDWVKTDAIMAACNLPGEHGWSSGKFDVFWTDGLRYDVDGVVTENALALDGGEGDDFPASEAEDVVVCPPQQIDTPIDGDEVEMFLADCDKRAHLYFEDADGDPIANIELQAGKPFPWVKAWKRTNPFTGDPITVCFASCGETEAGVLTILSLEDSTP